MEGTGWRDDLHERGDDDSASRPARVVQGADGLPLVIFEDTDAPAAEEQRDAIRGLLEIAEANPAFSDPARTVRRDDLYDRD